MRGPQVTDKADAGTIGASGPTRAANTARTAVVWEALKELLAQLGDREPLEIVDAGGGTGGVAVPLAELGHRVTVVEPSPCPWRSSTRGAVPVVWPSRSPNSAIGSRSSNPARIPWPPWSAVPQNT